MNPTTKLCSRCRKDLPLDAFHRNNTSRSWHKRQSNCKPCVDEVSRAYKAANPQKKRQYDIKSKYGVSHEVIDALEKAQGGVCAVCARPPGKRRLQIDHDHATGEVRGLLCVSCNVLLGHARDDVSVLERAISYLKGGTLCT